jgi:hypothetical protein
MSSMLRSRKAALGTIALSLLAASSCGKSGPTPDARTPAAAGSSAQTSTPQKLVTMVTPSRLVPDLRSERGVLAYENGQRRVLVDRMRLLVYEDGTIERAAELLPLGNVSAVPLPSRLGGGFVFHATSGGGTQLWRASSWLGKLKPLVQFSSTTTEVVPGFDRLYLRLSANNKLLALDPDSGEVRPLAPLPPSAAYGNLAFADGWRGVVEADLRGVLATFDAGTTWRPLDIPERPTAITVIGGDPALLVAGGKYLVDARGNVTFRADPPPMDDADDKPDAAGRPPGPFGKRPLRAAVEDGWPDGDRTAVVARGGALARISLDGGAIVATADNAYPERQASCHAVRLGASFGFVCGEREGPTSVYAFTPPLAMTKVMSFRGPRFVAPSGNGALVVRGPCKDGAAGGFGGRAPLAGRSPQALDDGETRVYCVRDAAGATREVRVKGDLGVERVVALSDGRVAVLVPPRAGSAGQLSLLEGAQIKSVPLTLPQKPRAAAQKLRRGMWLEGFEEREPGVLGGWVEAGGPVMGVRIALDGKVTAGDARDNEMGVIVAGRFGLSQGEGGRAAETTDGGMTWKVFDMPEHDADPDDAPTRACGPAGCALGGWIRVGWGKPGAAGDLAPAETPQALYVQTRTTPTVSFSCEPTGKSVTPPIPTPPRQVPARPPPSPPPFGGPFGGPRIPLPSTSGWMNFRNTPPPTIAADEVGIDNGTPYDLVSMRAYAWGKRGADWARTGHFLIRFDDRFDVGGGVRSSGVGAPPWSDEIAAAEAMGLSSYPLASWGAFLDPSGKHALVPVCRGTACALFAVSEGQPVLPVRDAGGRTTGFSRPLANGAVRLGDSWFFLTPGAAYDMVTLHRVDLGVARAVASFHRPTPSRYAMPEPPRLVRRALGTGLGLLVTSIPDPGERSGAMYVHPIDPDTGAIGEPIGIGKRDLGGLVPPRCAEGQDGWMLDTTLETTPSILMTGGRASLDAVELRLRFDPGSVCAEAMAARMDGTLAMDKPAAKAGGASKDSAPDTAIPLAATERATGKRWGLRCIKRGPVPSALDVFK